MEKIASELKGIKRAVTVRTNVSGDGCVGSCMGLYLYLRENYPEIETDVYLEQPRDAFSLISHLDEIRTVCGGDEVYDVFFLIDTSTSDRIGVASEAYQKARKRICIDHHVSNKGFGDINVVKPDVSSASEVLFGLLAEENLNTPVSWAIPI